MRGASLLLSLLLLVLPATAQGSELLLASYEPSETNLTVTSPDGGMTISWVLGGSGGAPAATDGSYVLKLDWVGEDGKVEVKHQWSGWTFDLAGYGGLLVDVYVETPSALPGILGIWDDVFDWLEGFGLPASTGQWVTVSMCVYDRDHVGLDHISALVFEDLAGADGTLYVDNLRLVPPRELSFAGHDWTVKCGAPLGPGPNPFSQSEEHVWVDGSGRLHLKIADYRDLWWCTEVILNESFGYGTYVFTVESRVDFDENIVLGLFTWDTDAPEHHYREIDFEFGRWGDPGGDNAQYVVQPWETPGNLHRFDIGYGGPTETTTHVITWSSDGIRFTSYYGDFRFQPAAENIIDTWYYTGADNPPPGGENARMNLWLRSGIAPANSQEEEVVVSEFRYLPPGSLPALGNPGLVAIVVMLIGAAGFALWRKVF